VASALITLQILATLLLLYPPVSGWRAAGTQWGTLEMKQAVAHHILTAFPGLVLAVFAHAMSLFYFIGTGRTVKDARKDYPEIVTEADVAETVRFKRLTSGLFTFAIFGMIAAPVSGGPLLVQVGGPETGWLRLHLVIVTGVLLLQLFTAFRAITTIAANVRLLQAIDGRFEGTGAERPAAH